MADGSSTLPTRNTEGSVSRNTISVRVFGSPTDEKLGMEVPDFVSPLKRKRRRDDHDGVPGPSKKMSEKNTDWVLIVFWDCKELQSKMGRCSPQRIR